MSRTENIWYCMLCDQMFGPCYNNKGCANELKFKTRNNFVSLLYLNIKSNKHCDLHIGRYGVLKRDYVLDDLYLSKEAITTVALK